MGINMGYEYIFFSLGIIFILYILLEDEISFYRLMADKQKYWNECFPRFLSKVRSGFIKILIGLLLILGWIYLPDIFRDLLK